MKVAVVILNWNGKDLLEQFLPSVIRHSPQATIYVADNASTDDSVPFLSENFSQITLLQNEENGGYANGYNQALKSLTEDIFVLLNSDVEVTKNWLTPVVEAFKNNTSLAAAQPKILDYKAKSQFEYAGAAGGFIDSLGYPYCRGRIFETLEEDLGQYDNTSPIFWASGACLFVRREAFWEVGGFDEDFFAHQEEIDLCWRLHAQGSLVYCISNSKIYHVGGATLEKSHWKKTFYNFRNSLLMIVKNVQGWRAWRVICQRLILDGFAGVLFLIQGKPRHFIAILQAHVSFYLLLPRFLEKRKRFASNYTYFKIKSIVWKYFITKKRNFNNL